MAGARRVSALGLAVAVAACGWSASERSVELSFAEVVGLQRRHVTTSRISAPEDLGLDWLGEGWRRGVGDDGPFLELVGPRAVSAFFSAEGEIAGVDLELAPDPGPPGRLVLRLNGSFAGAARVGPGVMSVRLRIPPEKLLSGRNQLVWLYREGEEPASLRIRRMSFLGVGGEPLPAAGVETLRLVGSADRAAFLMPGGSYLDLIAPLPEQAVWSARFRLERPGVDPGSRVTVRAERVAAGGAVEELFAAELPGSEPSEQELRVDLRDRGGQLAHLRLRVSGPPQAVVRWSRAGVVGVETAAEAPVEPVTWRQPPSSGRLGRPNVLMILLDAARADGFSCYGARFPTPAVDRLAQAGTRFERALSPAPWTGQSVPALFTGLYPDTLGIEHWGSRLPESAPMLAELMEEAGYHTVLWSHHPFYRKNAPLWRGFVDYVDASVDRREEAPEIAELLTADGPTFAFVHLLPPHAPYDPPAPYRGRYTDANGPPVDPRSLFHLGDPATESLPTEGFVRYVRDRYLENVAFADHLVGVLLDRWHAAGRWEDTLIVLLSDHGEGFFEHRRFLHSELVYDEFLRIPLVVKWPTVAAGHAPVVEQTVSLIDLVPTLVDGLGLEGARRFQGESLLPVVYEGSALERAVYAVTEGMSVPTGKARPKLAIELDGWKLVYDAVGHGSELYRLTEDPREQRDLASEEAERTAMLRRLLLRQRSVNRALLQALGVPGEVEELDAGVRRQLEALGYI